jgi:hypothetical protein
MHDSKKQVVSFQGQEFEIPVASQGTVQGKELIGAFSLEEGQTLIRPTEDGHQVVRPSDEVDVSKGEQFSSVGRFVTAGRNIKRLNAELKLLVDRYGNNRVYWPRAQDWVMIHDFELPKGWKPEATDIVVLLPNNYGHGEPLRDCFVNPGLRFHHKGKWVEINHYFDKANGYSTDKRFSAKDWRYLCLHMQEWKPESWIQSYLDIITTYLSNPYHPWPGNEGA